MQWCLGPWLPSGGLEDGAWERETGARGCSKGQSPEELENGTVR